MEIRKRQGNSIPLPKLVGAFCDLSELGIVRLSGQNPIGLDTEVHWNRNIIEVGKLGLEGSLAKLADKSSGTARADSTLPVDFPRDNGSILPFDFPPDMSVSEAGRLADIVRALGRG